jgi:hypothetical protein
MQACRPGYLIVATASEPSWPPVARASSRVSAMCQLHQHPPVACRSTVLPDLAAACLGEAPLRSAELSSPGIGHRSRSTGRPAHTCRPGVMPDGLIERGRRRWAAPPAAGTAAAGRPAGSNRSALVSDPLAGEQPLQDADRLVLPVALGHRVDAQHVGVATAARPARCRRSPARRSCGRAARSAVRR